MRRSSLQTGSGVIAAVCLTPRAEEVFQRATERVGGLVIDRDEALRSTTAGNFRTEVADVLEAVGVRVAQA